MISGASYQLREFRPENPVEIERMNLMYYHPRTLRNMGFKRGDVDPIRKGDLQEIYEELFDSPSKLTHNFSDISYAVADRYDRLVGWVWFCHDSRRPLPTSVAHKWKLNGRNSRAYQVVYERLLSEAWPRQIVRNVIHTTPKQLFAKRKGVIVEGLRLAIRRLSRAYSRLYFGKRKLFLYAYVLPDNIASQKVLIRNNFLKETKQYSYDGIWHDLWVRIV